MKKLLIVLLFTQIPAIAQQNTPLSLSDPELKSCQYPEHTRIGYFPMFYEVRLSPVDRRYYTSFELVSKSQFQLLHTIITYTPHIAVFSQGILTNHYNTQTYSQLKQGIDKTTILMENMPFQADDTTFPLQERYNTAWELFPEKIPSYYEHLSQTQKEFLVYTGGALTAWLLGQIPHIYKTASKQDIVAIAAKWDQIAIHDPENYQGIRLQILQDRATKLKEEVNKFYDQNPDFSGLALIAFDVDDKLYIEFPEVFNDGSFCLKWGL